MVVTIVRANVVNGKLITIIQVLDGMVTNTVQVYEMLPNNGCANRTFLRHSAHFSDMNLAEEYFNWAINNDWSK